MPKINIANQFQRSIRIDLDLDNQEALAGYIPVQSSLNMLRTMARAISEKHDYAFTWTGAYGSGKSALALMLLALLSPKTNIKKAASVALNLANTENQDILKNFKGRFKRICLVGGRKSLRADLYKQLCSLNGVHSSIGDDIPTQEIYAQLDAAATKSKLFIAIDELGKYLEFAIQTNDVYFLQELADYASRSSGKVIVLGILHQSFDAYVSYLPTNVREEWAKVQGRFENYLIEPSPYESLHLIAGSIVRVDYAAEAHAELNAALAEYLSAHMQNFKHGILELLNNCLPLHGITAILLASLARKNYGQNERTIYSFLNSMEAYSLNDYIEHCSDASPLYHPYDLYDYLRINQDININLSHDSHKWAIAKELIERFETTASPLGTALLKTIAVTEIFSAVFRISADPDLLRLCLNCTKEDFDKEITYLQQHSAIIFRSVDSAYHLFIGSDFDYELQLQHELLKTDFDISVLNILSFDKDRIIARRHYLETGNLRWMKQCLVSAENVEDYVLKLEASSDCFAEFVLVICSDESQIKKLKQLSERFSDRAIIGFALNSQEIIAKTREYTAAKSLMSLESLEGDEIARKEVDMRIHDNEIQLRSLLEKLTMQAQWFVKDTVKQLDGRDMSVIASDLADQVFAKAVPINNELINRSKLSPNVTASRRNLLLYMVKNCGKELLGIQGTPAEFSIFDNLIAANGMYDGKEISYKLSPQKELQDFFADTEKFINNKGNITLDELYAYWGRPPYGMKVGVMPVFALIFVLSNMDRYAFYDKQYFITEVQESIVEEILVNSDIFTIKSYKAQYGYADINAHIAQAIHEVMGVKVAPEPLLLARKLVRFVFTLKPLTLNTNQVSAAAKKLRAKLKRADDPISLLYRELQEIFPDLKDSAASLIAAMSELKLHYDAQLSLVKQKLFDAFDERDGLEHLAQRAETAVKFSANRQILSFKQLLDSYKDFEKQFIVRLIVLCSEMSEDSWTDAAIEKTLYDLPRLSLEFRQAECFSNVSDSSKARRMIALTFASSAADDTTMLAEISPNDENLIAERTAVLLKDLQGLEREQMIAVVAELGQKLSTMMELAS